MKTIIPLFLAFTFSFSSSAQVLCIKCYNQNVRVLTDTNNLIVNGGFENGCPAMVNNNDTSFCPNSLYYHCDIANWTCTGGGIGTYAHICDTSYSIIVEGTKAAYFGNFNANVCSSDFHDTSCISPTGCEVIGIPPGFPAHIDSGYGGATGISLQQTINGLTIGASYILEFWTGGEGSGNLGLSKGLFDIDVGFGKIFLRDPPTLDITSIGIRYVIVFSATSSSHTIKFTNWGHILQATELILDDVRLFKTSPDDTPCAIAIDEVTKNAITVSPNPATTHLTITTNTNTPSEIIIYDIASRKLMEEKFIKEVTLNIAHLARGVYIYQVTDAEGMVSRGKVVKE